MRRNLTQSFDQSDQVQLSLLIKATDNTGSSFVLTKYSPEFTDEYVLPSVITQAGDDIALTIAKFLYEHGMLLTSLRMIIEDKSVNFSFVDDTPGKIETLVCYYVQAEITAKNDRLIYVSANEFINRIEKSSFTDDSERAAVRLLTITTTPQAR